MLERRILCDIDIYSTQPNIMPYTLNPIWNNTIALSHTMSKNTLIYLKNILSLTLNDMP
jgi:hypothetical protein